MKEVDKIEIRMYGTGTGDCFILKYYLKPEGEFTMMFDGGTWKGKSNTLNHFVRDLKKYVNNKVDLLVISHEHKDHVYLFNACKELFINDFSVGEVWMAWTEDENDELASKWKDLFGQKKKALAMASDEIKSILNNINFSDGLSMEFNKDSLFEAYNNFSASLNEFGNLHFDGDNGEYKGDLKGMKIVKKDITKQRIRFFEPGNIESLAELPGIKFYILGPQKSIKAIKKKHGGKIGDTYDHNKILRRSDSFSAAVLNHDELSISRNSPFNNEYFSPDTKSKDYYNKPTQAWRRIDQDWLLAGAGSLALRLNSGLNNLSLVIAIEIEKTGDVLLFTGDAEFGNWESWHNIEWNIEGKNGKHFTEDLLNRTVFYKVAHHLSNNGTAKNKGLRMMKSRKLVSMASLDYDVISSNWKSTMPNRGILKDLITQTRGRLIIMNDKNLFFDFNNQEPLRDKIENARNNLSTAEQNKFNLNYKETKYYKQYTYKP